MFAFILCGNPDWSSGFLELTRYRTYCYMDYPGLGNRFYPYSSVGNTFTLCAYGNNYRKVGDILIQPDDAFRLCFVWSLAPPA